MLPTCNHCHTPFEPEKSGSAIRNTYCGVLCEQAGLGFSIVGLIHSELRPKLPDLEELIDMEWLDSLLETLPAAGAKPAEDANEDASTPLGFASDWKLYPPMP